MMLDIFWTVLILILTLKNEFMAADAKVVDVGSSVILRCPSKAKIRKCFFSRGDGDVRYRIRSGKKFENGRLQCLCDKDRTIDPEKVCGIHITEAKKRDEGKWTCEVEVEENGATKKYSGTETIEIKGDVIPTKDSAITPPPVILPAGQTSLTNQSSASCVMKNT